MKPWNLTAFTKWKILWSSTITKRISFQKIW